MNLLCICLDALSISHEQCTRRWTYADMDALDVDAAYPNGA